MDFRSPLPINLSSSCAASLLEKTPIKSICFNITCRMYVASQVMNLGTEARFTSIVLFHRYLECYLHFVFEQIVLLSDDSDVNEDKQNMTDEGNEGIIVQENNDNHNSKVILILEQQRQQLGLVAAACLFLGCKIEEEPRKIRDVINLYSMLDFMGSRSSPNLSRPKSGQQAKRHSTNDTAWSSRNDNVSHITKNIEVIMLDKPPLLDESYWELKQKIVQTEQGVLRLLQFDVSVSHPHRAVVIMLEELISSDRIKECNSILSEKYQCLLHGAWKRLNDALFYPKALKQPLLPLACAAIFLSMEKRDYSAEKLWRKISGICDKDFQIASDTLLEASNSIYEYSSYLSIGL